MGNRASEFLYTCLVWTIPSPSPRPSPSGRGRLAFQSVGTATAGFADALAGILPLPEGEGRGEGEEAFDRDKCTKIDMLPWAGGTPAPTTDRPGPRCYTKSSFGGVYRV